MVKKEADVLAAQVGAHMARRDYYDLLATMILLFGKDNSITIPAYIFEMLPPYGEKPPEYEREVDPKTHDVTFRIKPQGSH